MFDKNIYGKSDCMKILIGLNHVYGGYFLYSKRRKIQGGLRNTNGGTEKGTGLTEKRITVNGETSVCVCRNAK